MCRDTATTQTKLKNEISMIPTLMTAVTRSCRSSSVAFVEIFTLDLLFESIPVVFCRRLIPLLIFVFSYRLDLLPEVSRRSRRLRLSSLFIAASLQFSRSGISINRSGEERAAIFLLLLFFFLHQ